MKKVFLMICMGAIALSIACTDDTGSIINLPPSAVINAPGTVGLDENVTLDGTSSFDSDGGDLSYSWSFTAIPTGSTASIANADQATASFTTDVAGNYVVTLTVSDGDDTATDEVTILASNGQVPMPNITNENGSAFGDGNVFAPGEEITVSGATSFDIEDGTNLTYAWEFITQPAGSSPSPATATTSQVTFELDEVGDYTLQLTVTDSDDNTASATVEIEIDFIPILITQDITTPTTLEDVYDDPALLDYLVTKSLLNIDNELTVMAGVNMAFVENSGADVGVNGTIIAVGTATDSIVFRSESGEKGSWEGFNIQSNKSANKMQFVRVRDGGSGGFDGAGLLSNIMVEDDGRIEIANSTIDNGAGTGLYVRNLTSRISGFSSNVITNNNVPITCSINDYQFLDAATDFTGNANDYISTYNSSATSENVTWNKLTVPYRLSTSVQTIASTIIVAPGARFIGQSGSGIAIVGEGSLNATGNASETIIFEGEQDTDGVWRGLSFESNNLNNKLIYARVSNGGQDGFDGAGLKSNVIVEGNAQLIMQFTTVSNGAGTGLYIRNTTVR
ncbi:MAG: PKD domain-containing protein, partial [Cyclobacteriaceae bacterium]